MKLTAVIELDEKIFATQELLDSLRAKTKEAATSKLDGLPHGKATASRVETLTVKIVDTERSLDNLREEYAITMLDLTEEITRRVDGKAATVLHKRYVGMKSIPVIANEMDLSPS